jgi:hypothetical protein
VLGLPDRFITNLTMTTGAVCETPDHNPAKQHFTPGYLMLRGSRDLRDLVNVAPATNGYAFQWWGPVANKVINGSLSYEGALVVVGVPQGSQWKLALSDQPNPRTANTLTLARATGGPRCSGACSPGLRLPQVRASLGRE